MALKHPRMQCRHYAVCLQLPLFRIVRDIAAQLWEFEAEFCSTLDKRVRDTKSVTETE